MSNKILLGPFGCRDHTLVPPSRADGGLTNGGLGLKINDVTSVTGVTSKANALNLLGIMSLHSVWSFISGGCYYAVGVTSEYRVFDWRIEAIEQRSCLTK